jgi:adenosylhomocysteine nucleosidase
MCGTCEMVKGYLALRGVEFTERNVSTDLEGRAQLLKLGYDATPVTVIGDRALEGFDIAQLDAALSELS